jgi:putative Mg2+ transporter-C (MgtC) family protein
MYHLQHVNNEMFKLVLAVFLGGAIGLEREVSDKAAGLRTNILICVGACLFMMVSRGFVGIPVSDPTRIAAQIVSGIGFLGAGAIMHEGDRVTGLTTAATIWVVAAIGMAIGGGWFSLAAMVTVVVLFVQLGFTQLDIWIDDWRERHTFRIVSNLDEQAIMDIASYFREAKVFVMRSKVMKKNNLYYSEWFTTGGRASQDKLKKRLLACPSVIEVTY